MNRNEFIQKLEKLGACSEGLDWVRSTPGTPEEIWGLAEYNNLNWLCGELGFCSRYESKVASVGAEHDSKVNQLRDEYDSKVKLPLAELNSKVKLLGAELNSKVKLLWAEYDSKVQPLWDEYDSKYADIIRQNIKWSEIEAALDGKATIP